MTDAESEAMTHDYLPMWNGCQECLAVWLRRTAEYLEGKTPTTPFPAGHDHRDDDFEPPNTGAFDVTDAEHEAQCIIAGCTHPYVYVNDEDGETMQGWCTLCRAVAFAEG